jgi:hypothetical protein
MTSRHLGHLVLSSILVPCLAAAAPAQASRPASAPATRPASVPATASRAGDPRRVRWVRPWSEAVAAARASRRPILAKPIMGGSNTPDPDGVPCGGERDCEGSW